MNQVRQIQALNKRELEAGVSTSASWHNDYRDTAFIYIGGFPFDLSEGDIITIFSQYGEPTYINLVRDKETGKSKGFCFLKYEDQRSADLAVDNLGGTILMGRMVRVDHTRYKKRDDEEIVDNTNGVNGGADGDGQETDGQNGKRIRRSRSESEDRPMLKEERQLAELMRKHDDDDPMKQFMIEEKQAEVDAAVKEYEKDKRKRKKDEKREHKHRHHHSRRHDDDRRRRRSRSDSLDGPRKRSRSRTPTADSDHDADRRPHRRHR